MTHTTIWNPLLSSNSRDKLETKFGSTDRAKKFEILPVQGEFQKSRIYEFIRLHKK